MDRRRQRLGLWVAFLAAHAWLTWLGVRVVASEAFYDVDLYRWWMALGLQAGQWPVLHDAWVYPAGAIVPMLLPALVTTTSTPGYALAWCLLVTVLDAAALALLLRRGRGRSVAGWWWTAFLVLLGPVAIGRLDAVVAALMVVSLVAATERSIDDGEVAGDPGRDGGAAPTPRGTRWAAGLMTAGAWVKVAPGALLLPLAAAARRPWRDVIAPAAAVCAVVVGSVAAGGGAQNLLSFLSDQGTRGLQVESVAASPWVIASLLTDAVQIHLNSELITYEITGPGTQIAASVLNLVLVLAVAAVGGVLVVARRRGVAAAALLPASLTLLTLLIVTNKVGSPQYVTWLAAPLTVLLAIGPVRAHGRWCEVAVVVTLAAAFLTQSVFPWGYNALLTGSPVVAAALVTRNALLVVVLGCGLAGLRSALRVPGADREPTALRSDAA